MEKGFGAIFSESWREYITNFRFFVIIAFLFIFLPSVIAYLIGLPIHSEVLKLGQNTTSVEEYKVFFSHPVSWSLIIIWGIISFFLSIFAYCAIIYGSSHKKKLIDFKTSINGAKKNFLRFFLLSLFVIFILFLLLVVCGVLAGITAYISTLGISSVNLLLIILLVLIVLLLVCFVVYLSIRWSFSSYCLIVDNKRVFDSLRESHRIVYRKWWRTFGYFVLIWIILLLFSVVILMIFGIINIILNPSIIQNALLGNQDYFDPLWYVNDIITLISQFVSGIIVTPLSLLFGKNFYLSRKKK